MSTSKMEDPSFLTKILINLLGEENALKLCSICSVAWTSVSVICVCAIVGVTVSMKFQKPAVTEVKAPRDQLPTVVATPDNSAYVASPLTLGPDIMKAQYLAFLTDEKGTTVYRYPEVVVDRPIHVISAGGLSFKVPQLAPGTYYLKATVRYALNPLKEASLEVELARVIIQ